MNSSDHEIELVIEIWQAEVSRAIEIFTGEKPQVNCRPEPDAHLEEASAGKYLWWKQVFEAEQSFTVSIAAQQPAWIALGGGGDPDERCRQTYFDILRQAHDGVASTLGARTGKPFRCKAGVSENPASVSDVSVFAVEIGLGLQGSVRPELLLCVGQMEEKNLGGAEETRMLSLERRWPLYCSSAPMLRPLMDLDLPLAVALGCATMPIREILKITPGSQIELDRTVKDYVDLIVHGKVVARGEIVSVRGNYGVRIKQIISRDDRLQLRAAQ